MYINGKWIEADGQANFTVFNHATGEYIGEAPNGDKADALKAVQAASGAFDRWSVLTAYQRSSHLYKAYRIMIENIDHLAMVMTQEQGKPIKAARNEVQNATDYFLWFAEEAKRIYGRTIPAPRQDQRFFVLQHRLEE